MPANQTNIAALWNPQIWADSIREKVATFPVIMNSGIVFTSQKATEGASGPGTSINMPVWRDMTDDADEIQVEDTAPSTFGVVSANQIAPILNRVFKTGATALSAAVSGEDPVAEMTAQLALGRQKRRQRTLLAMLRGIMGTGVQTPGQAQGVVRDTRLDLFTETGATATSANLIDPDDVINAIALLGELRNELATGAMFMHSTILAALERQDKDSFKEGTVSGQPFTIRTYRGIPIFASDLLVRTGGTNGFVYDTYIIANRTFAIGEKPQTADTGDTVDVAALQFDSDKDKNNAYIYDRTRFMLHPAGLRWTGTPAGQSATNAELQLHSNWALAFQTANRVGIAAIRSNG